MRHVAVGGDVGAPAAVAWDLIARFDRWPEWGTTIRAVEADADVVAPGVTGRVQTIVGIWLPFEITDVAEGRSWTWTVAGRQATGHHVVPLGPARSRIDFTVAWPFALYAFPMWLAVRRIQRLTAPMASSPK